MADPNAPARRYAWYQVVPIASAGLLAWLPFAHAAIRLRTRRAILVAALFGVLQIGLWLLVFVVPSRDPETGISTAAPVIPLLGIALIALSCTALRPLRRAVAAQPRSN